MISLSNTTAQTLSSGQSITFNSTLLKSGCAECHRLNTGSVKLCAQNAIYEIHFSGNIAGGTAGTAVQLQLELGGDALPETTMIATPATADAYSNVSTTAVIRNNCCDYDRITVVNTGTTDLTVAAYSTLFVKRVA